MIKERNKTRADSIIDFDQMTARRTPDPERDRDDKHLRQDGHARPLLRTNKITIGAGMTLELDIRGDGVSTTHWTTPVTRIEKLR